MTSQRVEPTDTLSFAANDSSTRWRVLLAHNGALSTCDALSDVIATAMEDVQILDAPSAESARSILRRTQVDVVFVCLDLPPSPTGGIKLAQELVRAGCPLILVTRSLRWLPKSAAELRLLPWVTPEATEQSVVAAIDQAVGEIDLDNQITLDTSDLDDDLATSPRLSEV